MQLLKQGNSNRTMQSAINPPSPPLKGRQEGLGQIQMVITEGSVKSDKSLQSPRVDKTNLSSGQLMFSQKAISTIRDKMKILARELSEMEDCGIDENTLLKMFNIGNEKTGNLS